MIKYFMLIGSFSTIKIYGRLKKMHDGNKTQNSKIKKFKGEI